MTAPRVALIGIWLESNRSSPVAVEPDFKSFFHLTGSEILDATRSRTPVVTAESASFVKTMDATGPWEPVPILLTGCHPSGPIDADLFASFLETVREGLAKAGPLDAVYIANHGAMISTNDDDPDGALIALVREIVGPETCIIVTLDLHANISPKMVDQSDIIIGYLTNPHVDMIERGEEAALKLRLILAGEARPKAVLRKLPLAPPTVALLTASGLYGELIDYGNRRRAELAGEILNVSIFGGFVFSDCTKIGFSIVVTARNNIEQAEMVADEIATMAWEGRSRFKKDLLPLAEAVAMALDKDRSPIIFSDSGDNPGGGGSGRTTELFTALVQADAKEVLFGSFFDPPLALQAHAAGIGTHISARFNTLDGHACDVPFEVDAEVIGLHDGSVVGRLGLTKGRMMHLGPSAALRIGGIIVIVISDRMQTADPMFFEMFGLNIDDAHTVVVKSRGHFRAGFIPWFPPDRVYEVDTKGLTSPKLESREWLHLPRPIYPIDQDAIWTASSQS